MNEKPHDVPLVRIRPASGWVGLDCAELWQYRELFWFMVWRDVKVKYKQTFLGALWAILVPLFQMIIFTVIFGKLAGMSTDGLPAPIFYYTALLPWTYFATALNMSALSLTTSANLLTKIYFPRLIVPASPILAGLLDFAIAFIILILMMCWYAFLPPLTALLLPLMLLIAIITALGAGAALAALNVKYRDVRYMLNFLIQVWMYVTVIVPFSAVKAKFGGWAWLYGLNPLAGVIEGFRWCLLHPFATINTPRERTIGLSEVETALAAGGDVSGKMVAGVKQWSVTIIERQPLEAPWALLALGLLSALLILFLGLAYFKRMEKMFADIV